MNERIRQLAEQASEIDGDDLLYYNPVFAEKFAEMIVKECAEFRNELGIALCTDPSALYRYFRVEE